MGCSPSPLPQGLALRLAFGVSRSPPRGRGRLGPCRRLQVSEGPCVFGGSSRSPARVTRPSAPPTRRRPSQEPRPRVGQGCVSPAPAAAPGRSRGGGRAHPVDLTGPPARAGPEGLRGAPVRPHVRVRQPRGAGRVRNPEFPRPHREDAQPAGEAGPRAWPPRETTGVDTCGGAAARTKAGRSSPSHKGQRSAGGCPAPVNGAGPPERREESKQEGRGGCICAASWDPVRLARWPPAHLPAHLWLLSVLGQSQLCRPLQPSCSLCPADPHPAGAASPQTP